MSKPGPFSLLHDDCDPIATALQLNGPRSVARRRPCRHDFAVKSEQMAAERASSRATVAASGAHAQRVPGGASVGLVTSTNKVNTSSFQLDDTLTIDKLQSRCTRLRQNLGVAAKLLSNQGPRAAWMVTLTYKDANGWQPHHVRDCLRLVRLWASRAGWKLRYIWVMETQDRKSGPQLGQIAPHYHLVLWVPHGVSLPHFDRKGWWTHGMTNSKEAVSPIRYVMKYASKFDSVHSFPVGARCYGVGGLTDSGNKIRRWLNLPSFVKGNSSINCKWSRAAGGGWINHATGEHYESEWGRVLSNSKHTVLVRLRTHARLIQEPAGPYSFAP